MEYKEHGCKTVRNEASVNVNIFLAFLKVTYGRDNNILKSKQVKLALVLSTLVKVG